jgi:hypothetical protein
VKKKRQKTELAFDLAAIRKLKRLTKRVLSGLEEMDKHLAKMSKVDRHARVSSDEVALALDVHREVATRYGLPAKKATSDRHPLVDE